MSAPKENHTGGNDEPLPFRRALVGLGVRWVLFLGLWWVLSGGVWREPGVILGASFAGAAFSVWLCPPGAWRFQFRKVPGFVLWFLGASFLGGLDVARRAFSPSLPLESVIQEFSHSMTEKESYFFAWVVSLLPGTVCLEMKKDFMRIHSLDTEISDRMQALEARIKKLFRG
ncbi:MAG: Na+/H+ antiporter subunit E [Opitutales bacterium]|nr:Na+/H+ antiporter subunit E [Opitutales bacterium]